MLPLLVPILENKAMRAIFSEKGQKKAKYLKTWAKMYTTYKYFEKGKPLACDYRTHETSRICPAYVYLT